MTPSPAPSDHASEKKRRGFAAWFAKRTGRGPLRPRAQEVFDAGPTENDAPGFLYAYYEPGADGAKEWKIGKTTCDRAEDRMRQSATRNGKEYQLKGSWWVPWCGYTEKIVHADLEHLRLVPPKEKADGTGVEDGGTEWFRGDYRVIENRIRLAVRTVRARGADEGDAAALRASVAMPCCGIFLCGLPSRRQAAEDNRVGKSGRSRPAASAGPRRGAMIRRQPPAPTRT